MRYISTAAMTLASMTGSSATGSVINLTSVERGAFIITVSGSAASGNLQFQASNDGPSGYGNSLNGAPTNWANIESLYVTWATAGTYAIPTVDMSYMFGRLIYTNSGASTGSISAMFKSTGR